MQSKFENNDNWPINLMCAICRYALFYYVNTLKIMLYLILVFL